MLILITLSLLMAVAALLAVAYPIVTMARGGEPAAVSTEDAVEELLAMRDGAFQALRELRFDHEVGKITDEDYVVFEAGLKQTAANSLRALDDWESSTDRDLAEVLETATASHRVDQAVGGRVCNRCGREAAVEDKFCGRCGAPLPEFVVQAPVCPNCGHALEAGDRFCAGCGYALEGE